MDSHYLSGMATVLEATAGLTSQNQATIPAPIRKALKLRGGESVLAFSLLSDGTVRLAQVSKTRAKEEDSALRPFLKLLADDIERRPERLRSVSPALLKKAQHLVRKVKVDLAAPLSED
jgi:antitoxin PrlF